MKTSLDLMKEFQAWIESREDFDPNNLSFIFVVAVTKESSEEFNRDGIITSITISDFDHTPSMLTAAAKSMADLAKARREAMTFTWLRHIQEVLQEELEICEVKVEQEKMQ